VIQARNNAVAASGNAAQAGPAEAALSQATHGLFALMENYPQLKANDNVMQLQEELTTTENKIAFARQFYNDSVNTYNTRRQSFPAVLAAASLGFGPMDLFNMPEAERAVPKVALR
jgi:LemA protein